MRTIIGKKLSTFLKIVIGFNMCMFAIHYNTVKLTQLKGGITSFHVSNRDFYFAMNSTNDVYENRRRLVHDACLDHYTDNDKVDYGRILVDPAHSIMYCQVEKVGSSNWLRTFLILAGVFSVNDTIPWSSIPKVYDHYRRLSQHVNTERLEFLKQYTKFIFVRHPFNRLLSAYANKFERQPSKELIADIQQELRITPESNSSSVLAFQDFVRYLILTRESAETWNIHYRPIYYLCYPCNVTYDIIGQMETIADDSSYILNNKMGVDFEFPNFVPGRTNSSQSDILYKYFSTLTIQQVHGLYKIYELDFKLFGYQMPSFLNVTIS